MNRDQIAEEMEGRGLTAPHVTQEHVDNQIVGEDYHQFPGTTVTVCLLTLKNGFTVTGESACADPANFDPELGRKIARTRARDRIFALEGYLLRDEIARGEVTAGETGAPPNQELLRSLIFRNGYQPSPEKSVRHTPHVSVLVSISDDETAEIVIPKEGLEELGVLLDTGNVPE